VLRELDSHIGCLDPLLADFRCSRRGLQVVRPGAFAHFDLSLKRCDPCWDCLEAGFLFLETELFAGRIQLYQYVTDLDGPPDHE